MIALRCASREAGQNIPIKMLVRRCLREIQNLFKFYISLGSDWAVYDIADRRSLLLATTIDSKIEVVSLDFCVYLKIIAYKDKDKKQSDFMHIVATILKMLYATIVETKISNKQMMVLCKTENLHQCRDQN